MLEGVFIDFEGCSEVLMFFLFSFFYLMYIGLVTIYWHTLYLSFNIYIHICMFLHLSLHVLFLFYLYTHVSLCMQSFISVSHKMPWWVLFKCFRDSLLKSTMPWTLFLQSLARTCVRVRLILYFNKSLWV